MAAAAARKLPVLLAVLVTGQQGHAGAAGSSHSSSGCLWQQVLW